jgi:hypothetical protein
MLPVPSCTPEPLTVLEPANGAPIFTIGFPSPLSHFSRTFGVEPHPEDQKSSGSAKVRLSATGKETGEPKDLAVRDFYRAKAHQYLDITCR